jgi:3-oxoacyl-[acyl-carrier-protein] synthase-3
MTPIRGCTILGSGFYAPERRVLNSELEARLALEPGWIERRTGIRARYYAAPHEATSDLAIEAGRRALVQAQSDPNAIGLVLLATSTPDHLLPPTAPRVAHGLGIAGGAFDLTGACAGFLYGLAMADSFVRTHGQGVLLIAANVLSRRINEKDEKTAILFSDSAGALVLGPRYESSGGVLGCVFASDGEAYDLISIPQGGSRRPFSETTSWEDTLIILRSGPTVFSKVVAMMTETSQKILSRTGMCASEIARWVPHQANGRIVESVRASLEIPEDRVVKTFQEFGNASAASLAFSLAMSLDDKPLAAHEPILLTAVGAGLSGGALIFLG